MTTPVIPLVKLPAQYAPIARAAHNLPAGAYGVVICTEYGPKLALTPVTMSTVAATELADSYRGLHGCQVFIVRRGRDCVTVHTPDMAHAGNLLGTTEAPAADPVITNAPSATDAYWVALLHRTMHDDAAQADHDANIVAAMRAVHQLDAATPDADVWATALHAPREGAAYVTAFIELLYAGEHLTGRLYPTHV